MRVLHLLAGPHGAGKTSLFRTLIARRYPGISLVQEAAVQEFAHRLQQDQPFAVESNFSRPSALDLIAQGRSAGFEIVLYIVCVDQHRLLQARVKQSAKQGGLDVPAHKVITRYGPALALLQQAIELADLSLLIDGAAVEEGGPSLVASLAAGRLYLHAAFRPRWADKLLGFSEA